MAYKFLCILLVAFSATANALYNGNPNFPQMPEEGLWLPEDLPVSLKAGYEWDDTYNHYLNLQGGPSNLKKHVQKYAMLGNFGVFTLGLWDRFEAYGVFGSVDARINQNPIDDVYLAYKTGEAFAWSVGGRVIVAYFGKWRFSLDGKYFEFHPTLDKIEYNHTSLPTTDSSMLYDEWQVGGSVCYTVGWFIPYLGLKHSNVSLSLSDLKVLAPLLGGDSQTMHQRYDIGMFVGAGISPHKSFNFNIEYRFIDESALTMSADIRF